MVQSSKAIFFSLTVTDIQTFSTDCKIKFTQFVPVPLRTFDTLMSFHADDFQTYTFSVKTKCCVKQSQAYYSAIKYGEGGARFSTKSSLNLTFSLFLFFIND